MLSHTPVQVSTFLSFLLIPESVSLCRQGWQRCGPSLNFLATWVTLPCESPLPLTPWPQCSGFFSISSNVWAFLSMGVHLPTSLLHINITSSVLNIFRGQEAFQAREPMYCVNRHSHWPWVKMKPQDWAGGAAACLPFLQRIISVTPGLLSPSQVPALCPMWGWRKVFPSGPKAEACGVIRNTSVVTYPVHIVQDGCVLTVIILSMDALWQA